jgi:hypothetical protein
MRYARCPASTKESLGWVRRTQPDLWACVVAALAQGENLLPEPELPLIHLDSPYTGRDNCRVRQARLHSPLRSRTADEHVPLMKRAMDITGSLIALVLLSPLLLVIALTIKLTSKGPVFFRQKRIGQYGVPFVF